MNDLPRCPACEREGRRERVYTKMQAPHRGLPQCQWHGCVYIEGEWIYQCEMCGETVERLEGEPVPFLCAECWPIFVKASGTCSCCGQPKACCHC